MLVPTVFTYIVSFVHEKRWHRKRNVYKEKDETADGTPLVFTRCFKFHNHGQSSEGSILVFDLYFDCYSNNNLKGNVVTSIKFDLQKIAKKLIAYKKKHSLPIAKSGSRKTKKWPIREIKLPHKFSATINIEKLRVTVLKITISCPKIKKNKNHWNLTY